MFLQASVSHSVHRGGGWVLNPGVGTHLLSHSVHGGTPGYYGIRLTNGRYASYWNAFLFWLNQLHEIKLMTGVSTHSGSVLIFCWCDCVICADWQTENFMVLSN